MLSEQYKSNSFWYNNIKEYIMPKIDLKCSHCDKEFTSRSYKNKTRSSRFCNFNCYTLSRVSKDTTKKCFKCDIDFRIFPSEKNRIFCSRKCADRCRPKKGPPKNKGLGFWDTATDTEKKQRMTEKFEKIVIKTETCWGWKNKVTSSRYTTIGIGKNKWVSGHRLSWIINYGDIPKDKYVLHKCDNKVCTNPDHLFLGSAYDNSMDMLKKNRCNPMKGPKHPYAKLSVENIKEIKNMKRQGLMQSEIARIFKVSSSTILDILKGRTWKHIEERIKDGSTTTTV